tara:strand:+ start:14 stop:2116 length:2103 start_codon:yes stop_codon:yes gene_type:complete
MALTKVPSNLDATIATTQSASDNSTNVATTAYVTTAIANLVDGAPSTLNTLDEIAAALNDDAALNTTLTNSIATKLPLAGGTMTGDLIVTKSSAKLEATESGGASVRMIAGGSTGYIGNYSNHSLQILTNSTPAITIDNTQNATFAGTITSNNLQIETGAPTLTLNANTQATNKKKIRLAASQYTAGDFNIQQMNDDGTTIALSALSIINGGRVGVGKTAPTGSVHVNTKDSDGADVHVVVQNTTANRLAGYKIQDESGNTGVNLLYDNGSNHATLESPIGDLTLDVAGEIKLDADGGIIRIRDDGGDYGMFQISNADFIVRSMVSNKDLIFKGNDNGSVITALQLDMSDAGYAYFNRGIDIKAADGKRLRFTDADGTFRGGIQAVEGGGQMIATTAQHDIAIRSQSNMLFSSGGNTERMRITSGGNIGINIPSSQGVTTPAINFEAWDGDGVTKLGVGNNAAYVQRYQTHTSGPASLVIDKARGTQASPSKVLPGDDLGRIIFRGQTGSGLYEAASIQVEANVDNLVNNGADIPSDIYFKTTRDGGSGPLERMRIDYDGGIWHTHGNYGKYSWGKGVVFSAGQTQNLYFHLGNGNVYGSIRVHLSGDYGNVNTNGAMENVWGWGYNSVNTSQYGGGGNGTATIREGSTSNVFSFGAMTKTNNTTVKIPITNGNGSYQIHSAIYVEVIGEIQGLKYISIS